MAYICAVAALTSILAKVRIDGVNSNLATAVCCAYNGVRNGVFNARRGRSCRHKQEKSAVFDTFGSGNGCIVAVLLPCAAASKVVPVDKLSVVITLVPAFVFLHEEFTVKSAIGCVLIGAGTVLMAI